MGPAEFGASYRAPALFVIFVLICAIVGFSVAAFKPFSNTSIESAIWGILAALSAFLSLHIGYGVYKGNGYVRQG